ncbi:MAG: hypothetical protein WCJ02_01120 [bacterium]
MKTMKNEDDRLGEIVKRALEDEGRKLSLSPHIRRTVIAAAQRDRRVNGWSWLFNHKLVSSVAACLLIALGTVYQVTRPTEPQRPKVITEIRAEVLGGPQNDFWKKKRVEIHTRNGQEGYINIEATWPKQTSVIALHRRRTP